MQINAKEILDIPVCETHSKLEDFSQTTNLKYGPSPEIENNKDYTKLRPELLRKLEQAQAMLPNGIYLCIYEGHRSLATQELIFNKYYEIIKSNNPGWNHEQIYNQTIRLVSPVKNLDGSNNIPPHSTGGAVDLYLVNANDEPLDMGINPKDWMQDLDGSVSVTDSTKISATAIQNRKLMSDVLTKVGLVNYPNEYWHWSYGDKLWAYYSGEKYAKFTSC